MRWYGALVIEALRVLMRGGIYCTRPITGPSTARVGCGPCTRPTHSPAHGGGQWFGDRRDRADSGQDGQGLHERTPLVFGSADKVARVGRYLNGLAYDAERAPLFSNRGLFRE